MATVHGHDPYKSKEARQFERLVDIAFEAGKITRETYDKGMIVALEMEQAHRSRKGTPAVLLEAARVHREEFATLFDRDTAKAQPPERTER